MTTDDKEIVSAVTTALAGRVGKERFDLWFGRGVRLNAAGLTLSVSVSEPFRLEYVRRTFRADLIAVGEAILGSGVSLDLVLDPSLVIAAMPAPPASIKPASSAHAGDPANPPTAAAMAPRIAKLIPSTQPASSEAPSSAPAAPRAARRHFANLGDFIVGSGNQIGFSSAQTVVSRPGTYSPLTLVGPPGCGKTHLLEGIWRQVRQSGQLQRVIYLSAEQFTNQFLEALKQTGTPSFRRKYRDVEMLLIDDVHFLANKQSTIVEMVNTIDALLRDGRQLVFSADRPPAELRGLGPELIGRLSGGLVCPLSAADFATRLGILSQLAARQSLPISQDVLEWLAAQLPGDARQLAGALNRLTAGSHAFGQKIDLDFAQTALADLISASRRPVRVPEIVEAVCDMFGLEADQLQSSSKSPSVTVPRMLVMFLSRKYTRSALSEIGRVLGRKSHSTVFSAQQKVTQWLAAGKTIPLAHGQTTIEEALRRLESSLRVG